jgi:ABC-type Fe3+/spermidine/putrescine transport system ATPase subunit
MEIALERVSKRFGPHTALADVSLTVRGGEWLAVLGPSGSGKTTLLRILAGLERPDSGAVRRDGAVVGMVFQDLGLWTQWTARRHIAEVLRAARRNDEDPDEWLREFELAHRAGARPGQMSGGEQQRLALARALARRPNVLLLDEPFASLDPMLRRALAERTTALRRREGFAVVYVSHYLEPPVRSADRVVLLRDGRVEQEGTWQDLLRNPASDWVREFLCAEWG